MAKSPSPDDQRGQHGATHLPRLRIDSYNLPLRDPEGAGFLGDRASQTAFRALLDARRRDHLTGDADPFGDEPIADVGKKAIDLVLVGGDADAAHLVHAAVEAYAAELVTVVDGFLQTPEWSGVERIVLGGGFPEGLAGGLAIRRAQRLLDAAGSEVRLLTLSHDADDGGLLGWVQLLPKPFRKHYAAFLAVDIGGTNLRCGLVEHRLRDAKDGHRADVAERTHWRHANDAPSRAEALTRLAAMLNGLTAHARTLGLPLAPFVGIACPGQVEPDGTLSSGAQNLPGDWEAPFDLPAALLAKLDDIDGRRPLVVMHNDAVVQGLSERPAMRKVRRWGVMTIGTGLGNASFTTLR